MICTIEQKKEAHAFYKEALELLNQSGAEYMLGGAFAMFHYTCIYRDTKDLDVFCKYSEFPKILTHFGKHGYRTELTDARWLAKVFHGEYFIDIIFQSPNAVCLIDDTWYERAVKSSLEGVDTLLMPPEELLWCKIYVQNRERYDGADVNHLILQWGKKMDWKLVLTRMDQHWQLLLAKLLNFQFVYPADYHDCIPRWLFDELMERAFQQYELPPPQEKVCRGPLIDQTQYSIDVRDWNYKAMTIKTI
jgi:hypothetical protein